MLDYHPLEAEVVMRQGVLLLLDGIEDSFSVDIPVLEVTLYNQVIVLVKAPVALEVVQLEEPGGVDEVFVRHAKAEFEIFRADEPIRFGLD